MLDLFEADLLAVSIPPPTTVDSAVSAVSGPASLITPTDVSAILTPPVITVDSTVSGPASLVTATDVSAISTPPVAVTDCADSVVSRGASLPTATASNGGTPLWRISLTMKRHVSSL